MRGHRSALRDVTAEALTRDVARTFQRLVHLPYPLLLESTTHAPVTRSAPVAATESSHHERGATSADTQLGADHPNTQLTRYSFAAADPDLVIRATGLDVDVVDQRGGTTVRHHGRALDIMRALKLPETPHLEDIKQPAERDAVPVPPFQGGWAGYVGYEYGGVLERIPSAGAGKSTTTTDPLPDVVLARYPWILAWDHIAHRTWIIAIDAETAQQAYEQLFAPTESTDDDIASDVVAHAAEDQTHNDATDFSSSLPRPQYEAAVAAIRHYIQAGDVFQVNLSQQFSTSIAAHPWELYRHLRLSNPAPFAAYFDIGSSVIVSVSPERFLKLSHERIAEARPIKGTRPRGTTAHDDQRYREELEASVKDAAEHVMIVDVLRNDIGRVSAPGSVVVQNLKYVETHPTVHHLVSTITGQLRDEADAVDLFHASFPGGSITGAPKVRAMEIIAELETVRRGVYCGTIGYFDRNGAMDMNIAIRTCVFTPVTAPNAPARWNGTFSAGGGVVFDSAPAAEYDESIDKARAIMRAIRSVGAKPAQSTS